MGESPSPTLSYSYDYLDANQSVKEHIKEYAKRNGIKTHVTGYETGEERLHLTFKSVKQMEVYLRLARWNYPYFEFA